MLNAYPPEAVTVANITTDLNLTLVNEIAQLATAIISTQNREVLALVERISMRSRLAALESLHV